MRQFYLGKNSSGYYRVYFVDPVTGTRGPGKSTHTKDKVEATLIAGQWLKLLGENSTNDLYLGVTLC